MTGNMIVLIVTCKDDVPAEMGPSMGICILLYHPPTNLREGNVFTGVCHTVQGGVCMPGPMSLLGGCACLVVPGPFRGGLGIPEEVVEVDGIPWYLGYPTLLALYWPPQHIRLKP